MATPSFSTTHADLSSTSNVSSLTSGSMAVSGSNKLLLGAIASGAGSPVAPSGVKWGGSGGTDLTKQGSTVSVGPYGRLSIYSLVAPTDQTSTVYYYWPSAQDETVGGTLLFTGVDQSTPLGTVATNTGTNNTTQPSVTVSSAVDDLVIAVCWMVDTSGQSRTITAASGGTVLYDVSMPIYEFFVIESKVATSTSTTMNFTISGSASNEIAWGVIGVAVKGAGGGGASASLPPEISRYSSFLVR